MTLLSSSPQHCLKGERGEIKIILDCFQIVYYDLTINLNIFCEGLFVPSWINNLISLQILIRSTRKLCLNLSSSASYSH